MEEKIEQDPTFQENRIAIENYLENKRSSTSRSNNAIITIPTVVHIVYNDPIENISDAQVLSQIQVLNEDFRRLNADAANTPLAFQAVATDVEIEFCLANMDPNGFTTTGITRTMTSELSFGIDDQIKFNASNGKDAWDTQSYLNIWVGDLGILLGYAQLPDGSVATDGIVIDYQAFGTIGTATSPFHLGRTATHEVGHWLNLYHIWGDGGCSLDDAVSDTPLAGMPSSNGSPCTFPSQNTCDEGVGDLPDMFQNFMDYSHDACMNLFTNGQKTRMRSLFEGNNARSSILNSNGCSNIGSIATCSDGLQNGDETGIDCGGNCIACGTLCSDGIKNGNETGIDCGGDCINCDLRCKDGIQNGDETGIDCGGSACTTCPSILSFSSTNDLSFSDPCNCSDPKNCRINNTLLFQDVMRIPSSGRLATGLDIRVASSANFFIDVPCGGTLLAPVIGQNGTRFKEVSTGIYELEFWRPSDYLPKLSIVESNRVTVVPNAVFKRICSMEACTHRVVGVPTLSQWGKFIFLLLVLNISVIVLFKLENERINNAE